MATSIFRENFPGVARLQEAVDAAAFVIGLDLHKQTVAICVVDRLHPTEPVLQRSRVKNTGLAALLTSFVGPKVVVCEAAYGWQLLERALRGLPDVTFIPYDARKTAAWIASSGVKTDRLDAQVLCHACLTRGTPHLAVFVPERSDQECVRLVHHRDQLVGQRRRTFQRLRALERDTGPNPYTGEIQDATELTRLLEEDLRTELTGIQTRIAAVEDVLDHLSADDAIVRRLRTIPGVGRITSFALRHKVGTIARFRSPAHLASYFGLAIRERQSGDTKVKGRIAKAGDRLIRTLLVQGAQSVRSRRPDLARLYFPNLGQAELMADRRHANRVVIALARKQLTLVWQLWTHGVDFDLEVYKARRAQALAAAVAPAATCPPLSLTAELGTRSALQGRGTV